MNRQALGTLGDLAMKLTPGRRHALRRYGVPVALASLVLLIRGALPAPQGTAFYELALAAVVLSAWFGGREAGLLALLICAAGILYWFIPPHDSFTLPPGYALNFGIFIVLGIVLSEFGGWRRRAEQALRASEERFRTLVQFSFDVYWETDAQHRFTRQEHAERLGDAPAVGSEIGRTRWEVPHVEPDEEAWREHRATLEAHLPFRDFELARPVEGGGRRYVSVSGMPVFDESGKFAGYRGVGRHITERKLADAKHRAHVWFLESLDSINRAMQATSDLEKMMGDVLDGVLEIFATDRAWLYPCDSDAPAWRPVMERTRAEFPGAASRGGDLPMTAESAAVVRAALESPRALLRGGSHELQPARDVAEQFGVRSDMLMALHPKGDRPYLFGVHQCARPRTWTDEEQRLFEEIGHRLADALASLTAFRSLRESEQRLEAAQRLAHVGWWERDYASGHASLSEEAGRIFGVQPVDLPYWDGRWRSLIHPEDRSRVAAASEAALRGGPRYDVEYRVVRPDGAVRVVHSQGDVTRDESGRPLRQFGVMQDITELRLTERRLEAAQRLAHVGWWERDFVAGRWLTSDEVRKIYGIAEMDRVVDLAEWMKVVPSIIHPEDRRRVLEANEASLRRDPRYDIEYRIVHGDGTVRVVHVQADLTRDESGRPVRQFGVAQDITELRRAEDELRASQARLEEAQRIAHLGYWERDLLTNRVVLSEESWRIFGIPPHERTSDLAQWRERWLALIHSEDRPRALAAVTAALAGGPRYDAEYRIIRPDGEERVVHSQGDVMRDASGRPCRMFGTQQDITERRQAEQELRARQEMLDLAQKAARAVAFDWYIGARESENRWSPELEMMYGLEPGGFDRTYGGWKKLVHPDDWPAVLLAIKRAHQSGDVAAEYRVIHKDGSVHWLQAKGRMFFDAEGRPERMVGFMIDVTDRRRAEEELRAAEARFRTFVDHATDAFFLHDEQLRLIDVNRQACQGLGYAREELIGVHPRAYDTGLDDATVARLAKRVASGETVTFETSHRRKDGTVFPVEIRVRMFEQGDKRFHLALARDISARKRDQEAVRAKEAALQAARNELARVSRLTTLGELTASIAHEVNQPLGAMVTNAAACARWLAAKPPNMAEARAALGNIAADGKRAGEIITRIRALSKRQAPRMEPLDVSRKVLEVIALAEHELRSQHIVLHTELDPALPRVAGDRVQLQQVLLNLILNAIDAMSPIRDRARELTIVSRRDGPDAVLVEVRDSGPGFGPGGAERVFEPFYTTKPEGIGIGLSISRSIIEAHGGRLWAAPGEPCGAVFRFSLPAVGKGAA